jgi:hypothetical protein
VKQLWTYRSLHNAYYIDIRKYPAIIYCTNEPINALQDEIKLKGRIRNQERSFKGRVYPNKRIADFFQFYGTFKLGFHKNFKSSTMQSGQQFQSGLPPQTNKLTSQKYNII